MENVLLIKVNDLIWNDCERELLHVLETAVNNFLSAARRKCRIEQSEVVEKLPERTKGDSGDVAEADVINSVNIDEFESISSSDDNEDGVDIDTNKIWDMLNSGN
ncbi:hypothetical protein SNE40_014172 [Patella caerulea]|uniref:Uncharacterized protein n=1 Tax=Patella caerulea TaxID=87958 RepID=A0AAN8JF53_PATCE